MNVIARAPRSRFAVTSYKEPEEEPFFAIVQRDGASLFVKAGEASPRLNPKRDPAMRWDAYCYTLDPDALATEFAGRGAPLASRSRTQRMVCAASRSPTLTAMLSSLDVRERWRSVSKFMSSDPRSPHRLPAGCRRDRERTACGGRTAGRSAATAAQRPCARVRRRRHRPPLVRP